MNALRRTQANPMLIGAGAVLITLVAVFLAYNANSGLPLVPSYRLTVEVPDAARLTAGNEVRIRGRRAGIVERIEARTTRDGTVYARLGVKLDVIAGPLPADTRARVRPRSTLGLKYLELTPGDARRMLPDGGTLPLRRATPVVEIDQALTVFDAETRRNLRGVVHGLSDGLAGRGADLNEAIGGFEPVVDRLIPVVRTLADPATDLAGMVDGLAGAAEAAGPVTAELRGLVRGLASTFAAVDEASDGVVAGLAEAPRTSVAATRSLRAVRPVLDDAAALVADLRPGTRLLPGAAAGLADLSRRGTPVLERAIDLGPALQRTLDAVGRLAAEPSTAGAVGKLTTVVASLEPLLREANPFQTECNYLGVWTRNVTSVISEGDAYGNWFRFAPVVQTSEILQSARPAPELHVTPYGNFDGECEVGNEPFVTGQRIGNPPGLQPQRTADTAPPEGVPPR